MVTVTATVICWYTGANDVADFYYTTIVDDGNPISWTFIESVDCARRAITEDINDLVATREELIVGSKQDLSVTYKLPEGSQHAVRVNFSYRTGERDTTSSCVQSTEDNKFYNDVDDLVFQVENQNTELLV